MIEEEVLMPDEDGTTYVQEATESQDLMTVLFSHTTRGKPAIVCNGIRYTMMSENKKRVLWRCAAMMSNLRKCPARIAQSKTMPPTFTISHGEHIHAELKRGRYNCRRQDESVESENTAENVRVFKTELD